jgi:hypothetical protein
MDNFEDKQAEKDHAYVYSCACNLLLYDEDPGPRQERIGGPGEQRIIDRRELLIDLYARLVLFQLGGSSARLARVTAIGQRQCGHFAELSPPPEALSVEMTVTELAETAVGIVHESGADTDSMALRRLLAALDYQLSRDVFGTFFGRPDLAGPPDELLDRLERIDQEDPGPLNL